ncbi:GtrA family protein [Mucilaginibacter boryungensis]|uniref:GtrA family protein n=1 Tax=Mucilaginibacter boryungensis TaxID=768480 RepID=A0ABR9XIP5_9SPHI|nr:GtrA family protein [Mucilaginibacter boryungensis]MBE9666883.1 GtrA family protein [Mucilaginibacter boryungensis]
MPQSLIKRLSKNQVARFVLSAGLGFLVDIICFYLFYHNIFEQKYYNVFNARLRNFTLSLAVSFFAGVMVNFLMTRYIVFTESKTSFSKQFFRFTAVAVIGFFANQFLLELAVNDLNMYPPLARPLAALSLFFASFFIHKAFSFSLSLRHHAGTDTEPSSSNI